MAKANPYLMFSLEDAESKALAQVLSNDTARQIIKYLTEHDNATESGIAEGLGLPLSTVHYNVQNLVDANMVKATEFHYSEKGKEVMHYTLSNKIIIIAPKREERMKLLRRVLPVAVFIAALAGGLQLLKQGFTRVQPFAAHTSEAAPEALKTLAGAPAAVQPFYTSVTLWFVVGAVLAVVFYIVIDSWLRRRKS